MINEAILDQVYMDMYPRCLRVSSTHWLFVVLVKFLTKEDETQRVSNLIIIWTHFLQTLLPDIRFSGAPCDDFAEVKENGAILFAQMRSQMNNCLPHHVISQNSTKKMFAWNFSKLSFGAENNFFSLHCKGSLEKLTKEDKRKRVITCIWLPL